jgi:lipopolysaccharide biosynthesis glycosyltransferase
MSISSGSDQAVVLCFDQRYGPMACCVLTSLFLNNPQRDYSVELICAPIDDNIRFGIKKLGMIFDRSIVIHETDKRFSFFHEINRVDHITEATFFRLLIPRLVSARRVLYLDCDVIVQTNISELFSLANNQAFCGVPDLRGEMIASPRLGLASGVRYLNAGVMVFDNDIWRTDQISEGIIKFVAENRDRLTWNDQCAINGFLNGRTHILSRKYNYMYSELTESELKKGVSTGEFDGILHYSSSVKPWHRWCLSSFKQIWDKYSSVSPISPRTVSVPRSAEEWRALADASFYDGDYERASKIYRNLTLSSNGGR